MRFIIRLTPSALPIKVAAMATVMFDLLTERSNFQSFPSLPSLHPPFPPPPPNPRNYKLADFNAKSTVHS